MTGAEIHPSETSEYWRRLAREERANAEQKRNSRWGTVESISIHRQNAADYDATADRLESGGQVKTADKSPQWRAAYGNKFGRRMYLTGIMRGASVDVEAKHEEWIDALQKILDGHEDMLAALRGVVRVADRKTVEFDAARAAIARAEGRQP